MMQRCVTNPRQKTAVYDVLRQISNDFQLGLQQTIILTIIRMINRLIVDYSTD